MLTALRISSAWQGRAIAATALVLAGLGAGTPFVWHAVSNGAGAKKPGVKVEVLGSHLVAPAPQTKPTSPTASTKGGGSGGANSGGNNGNGLGNGGGAKLTFTFSGSVGDLQPNAPATLPIKVTNPSANNGTLTLNTITVKAANLMAGNSVVCSADQLIIAQYDSSVSGAASYVIPQGGSATVPLAITFTDSTTEDQTSCRGTTIPLTVNGTGTVTR